MIKINVSSDIKQEITQTLSTGKQAILKLSWDLEGLCWFCSISYNGKNINTFRITATIPMLNQFSNIIPFNLVCFTTSGNNPFDIKSFESGIASGTINGLGMGLYFLTTEEAETLNDTLIS